MESIHFLLYPHKPSSKKDLRQFSQNERKKKTFRLQKIQIWKWKGIEFQERVTQPMNGYHFYLITPFVSSNRRIISFSIPRKKKIWWWWCITSQFISINLLLLNSSICNYIIGFNFFFVSYLCWLLSVMIYSKIDVWILYHDCRFFLFNFFISSPLHLILITLFAFVVFIFSHATRVTIGFLCPFVLHFFFCCFRKHFQTVFLTKSISDVFVPGFFFCSARARSRNRFYKKKWKRKTKRNWIFTQHFPFHVCGFFCLDFGWLFRFDEFNLNISNYLFFGAES